MTRRRRLELALAAVQRLTGVAFAQPSQPREPFDPAFDPFEFVASLPYWHRAVVCWHLLAGRADRAGWAVVSIVAHKVK